MTNFYQSFIEMMAMWSATKNVLAVDLLNVGQGHHLQKSLYIGYYTADFNKTFIKMMQLSAGIRLFTAGRHNGSV